MIDWFIKIKNKEISSFIIFDTEKFYHSNSENLFKIAIQLAKESINISDWDSSLINQAWKALLFHDNITWVKQGNKGFDVPMGYFDEAEICELVGKYILNQLKDTFQTHSVGHYRDDSLTVLKGLSGPEIERMKKRIIKIFKNCGFKTTISNNLEILSLLDVTLNLHKKISIWKIG